MPQGSRARAASGVEAIEVLGPAMPSTIIVAVLYTPPSFVMSFLAVCMANSAQCPSVK